jgi:hypothetical protein
MGRPWADKDKTPWEKDGKGPDGGPHGSLTFPDESGEEVKKSPSGESGTSNMEGPYED